MKTIDDDLIEMLAQQMANQNDVTVICVVCFPKIYLIAVEMRIVNFEMELNQSSRYADLTF